MNWTFSTLDEFYASVQDALTASCAIPFQINGKELERITILSAKWFWANYEYALQERYLVIPRTIFNEERYKKERSIKLPECVFSVLGVKKLKEEFGSSTSWDGTADFSIERVFLSNSNSMGEITDNLLYYVTQMYWLDVASHVLTHTISYNYNHNTQMLWLSGETPDRDIVVNCDVKIPIENLINDEKFYRYVVAKCKVQLSRMLGTFDFTLVGDVKINFDSLRDEGKEEIEEIKEEIKSSSSNDFFITSGGA